MDDGVSQLATAFSLSCMSCKTLSCACFLEETHLYLAMCVCRANTDLCLIVSLIPNIVCFAADYGIVCIHTDRQLPSALIHHVITVNII